MDEFPRTELILVGSCSLVVVGLLAVACGRLAGTSPTRAWVSVCVSLFIQFVVYPLCVINVGDWTNFDYYCQGNANLYRSFLICTSLAAFCIAFAASYSRGVAPSRSWTAGMDGGPAWLRACIYLAFYAVALICVISIRSKGLADLGMVDGKHTGDSSGWLIELHLFGVVPIVHFLCSRRTRWFGMLMLLTYGGLRIVMDGHDRFSVIVPFIALTLVMWRDSNLLERQVCALLAACMMIFLVVRGHDKSDEFIQQAPDEKGMLVTFCEKISSGADVAMVANFYTHLNGVEQHGFSYGLPLVQTLTTEFLPRSIAPWKNSIFNFVDGMRFNNESNHIMRAGKSSVVGSLYAYGGYLGVVAGALVLGRACRHADRLAADPSTGSFRAVVLCFLSSLWLICISRAEWTVKMMLMISAPWLVVAAVNLLWRVVLDARSTEARGLPRMRNP